MTKTLVIHVPASRSQQQQWASFDDTLAAGLAEDCAIYQALHDQIEDGCGVVLLDKEQGKRAEGTMTSIAKTTKAKNGVQRYNVYVGDLKRVQYKSERLNRCGISLI